MIRIENGQLLVGEETVEIGNLHFVKEISRGANGIVFLAVDTLLNRTVAFKIWLKLRAHDNRDKKLQGLHEIQKQLAAQNAVADWQDPALDNPYFIPDKGAVITVPERIIGQVYQVGYCKDYFYTVMEFINGVTLKSFLTKSLGELCSDAGWKLSCEPTQIPLGLKAHIALKLAHYNNILMQKKVVHGDLHWKNIMIKELACKQTFLGDHQFSFDLCIIDFGTSYYIGKEVSIERSFLTLMETIDHCIAPFKLCDIKASDMPTDKSHVSQMNVWIQQQLYALRAAFFELGQEYVGWPFYRAFGTYMLTTKGFGIDTTHIKEEILRQVEKGTVILSRDFLGESENWDTFDGRTAIRGD